MENCLKTYGYSCAKTSECYIFACFVLHIFCERQKSDVDTTLIEEIILEQRSKTIIDKVNSYTTPMGRKVRNTITRYFKEYLWFCCLLGTTLSEEY